MSTIVIVGAGPRGTGLLERLAASAPELHPDGLDVHLVDPYPPGAGRIWRHAQSPLLAMNSMAADVTMYTDESVVCEGPIVPGPSFWDWAQTGARGRSRAGRRAGRASPPATFPSRRLQSAYLGWVLQDVLSRLPAGMRVHLHRTRATGLTEDSNATASRRSCTWRTGRRCAPTPSCSPPGTSTPPPPPTSSTSPPAPPQRACATCRRSRPPTPTSRCSPPARRCWSAGSASRSSTSSCCSTRAAAAASSPTGDGLRYVPSGNEPYLVAGSPRGAPYHAKTHYQLRAGRPPLPRFLGPAQTDPLIAAGEPVDMRDAGVAADGQGDRLGLVPRARPRAPRAGAAAVGRSSSTGSPRSTGAPPPWTRSSPRPCPTRSTGSTSTPSTAPSTACSADSLDALQPLVRAQIAEDLRQHVDERHTPHLGAFVAMLSVYAEVGRLAEVLSVRSRAVDMGRWQSFFNSVASGPPGFRVRELLALARAGYVRFLGPGHARSRSPTARSGPRRPRSPRPSTTDVLVDARLPDPSASRSCDPLLAALMRDGAASEEVLRDEHGAVLRNTGQLRVRPADGALVDAAGRVHPRRFAIGPHTTVRVAGAFTRPGMNAQSLRYNDAVARAVLRALADVAQPAAA